MATTYLKLADSNRFVQVDDDDRVTLLKKADLKDQRDHLQAQIDATPTVSNQDLLAWAKLNYPSYVDLTAVKAELARVKGILDVLNSL